jgi:hypothetical protein
LGGAPALACPRRHSCAGPGREGEREREREMGNVQAAVSSGYVCHAVKNLGGAPRGCRGPGGRVREARGQHPREAHARRPRRRGEAYASKWIARRTCILFSALTQQVQWLAFWWVLTSTFHTILGLKSPSNSAPFSRGLVGTDASIVTNEKI